MGPYKILQLNALQLAQLPSTGISRMAEAQTTVAATSVEIGRTCATRLIADIGRCARIPHPSG